MRKSDGNVRLHFVILLKQGSARTHNLQLDALAIDLNCADLEVDADCRDKRRRPCIIAKPQEQA